MLLTTDHIWEECRCTDIVRIVEVSHPVDAEIHVRACVEFAGAPVRAAMDVLSKVIGRRIIDHKYAEELIERHSRRSIFDTLQDVDPVLLGAFGRRYYVRRDILKACAKDPYPKCVVCGIRKCRDRDHLDVEFFASQLKNYTDGYVYFLLHEPTKFLKVGFSSTPPKRLQTHRASIPGELTAIGIVAGGRCLERAIHCELHEWLAPGHKEWFYYSKFVMDYIDRIVGLHKDLPHEQTLPYRPTVSMTETLSFR